MAQIRVEIEVRVSWWVRPYLFILYLFALVHGAEPDQVKMDRVVRRGLRTSAK